MSIEQKARTAEDSSKETSIFQKSIEEYITKINSLVDTMPIVLTILASNTIMYVEKLKDFIKEQGLDQLEVGGSTTIPIELYKKYERLTANTEKATEALLLYPCNQVVSIVSIYDAFLGNIIKAIYKTCPEKLKECNREFSIEEIVQFESIEEAKERAIEKEVETVIRNSHSEQLEWLSKKLKSSFKDFDSYSQFIEITERRNLFVHTNGVVSRQYLKVCKENNVGGVSDIKIGDILYAEPEYVINCHSVLFEVGVKLGVIVWRKLRKGDADADYYLNTICYNLLKQERYELAKTMLHFATDVIKNPANEDVRRLFVINKALAYYLSGDKEKCNTILNQEDWTASAIKFQLALAVLKDDYKSAAAKMELAKTDLDSFDYYEWPLFKVFRESEEFKFKYEELYGQGFKYKEPKKENIEEILAYAMDIRAKTKKTKEKTKEAIPTEECGTEIIEHK